MIKKRFWIALGIVALWGAPARMEPLEAAPKQHLSLSLQENGILTIRGRGPDTIDINREQRGMDRLVIKFNGGERKFQTYLVRRIHVNLDGSNDCITIGDLSYANLKGINLKLGDGHDIVNLGAISAPVEVRLGHGNDRLNVTGSGIDWLFVDTGHGEDTVNAHRHLGPLKVMAARTGHKTIFGNVTGWTDIATQKNHSDDDITVQPNAKICVDNADRVTFYPANPLPRGFEYDEERLILVLDLRNAPVGFDYRVIAPYAIEIFWNEPWGRTSRIVEVRNLQLYFPPGGANVVFTGFEGIITAFGGPGDDTLLAEDAFKVWFDGGPGNDRVVAGFAEFIGGPGNDFMDAGGIFFALDGVVGNDNWPGYDPTAGDRWGNRDAGGGSIVTDDRQYDANGNVWVVQGHSVSITKTNGPSGSDPLTTWFYVRVNGEPANVGGIHRANFNVLRIQSVDPPSIDPAVTVAFAEDDITITWIPLDPPGGDDLTKG